MWRFGGLLTGWPMPREHSSRLLLHLALVAGLAACGRGTAPARTEAPPQRIVSLVPAVTEMLFAIGAGPRVIAVSSFDHWPPDVAKLTRVGGLLDPDIERIL